MPAQACQHLADFLAGPGVQPLEDPLAALRQRQRAPASVGRGRASGDEPLPTKSPQDAAQIPRVERECLADAGGGDPRTVEDLVHHPDFRQRERGVVQTLIQESDLSGVESIEVADGGDGIGGGGDQEGLDEKDELSMGRLVAPVNYSRNTLRCSGTEYNRKRNPSSRPDSRPRRADT